MVTMKTKWMVLAIAVFFAILQPFIHAHLNVHHPIEHTGFNVANAYEEINHHSGHPAKNALSSIPHASYTLSVASGIKNDVDIALAINSFTFILFFLCFVIVLWFFPKHFQPLLPDSSQSLKHQPTAPRAPPLL
jgi:hypothetical protein